MSAPSHPPVSPPDHPPVHPLVHRGRITAAGFVVDVSTLGVAEARRRVLARHRAGDRVLALDARHWLVLPTGPIDVHTDRADGMPLVASGRHLVATPGVDVTSLDRTTPPSVVRVVAGVVVVDAIDSLLPIDMTAWIDVGALPVQRLAPLVMPPPPPGEIERDAADLRGRAGVAPTSSEAADVARSLGSNEGTGPGRGAGTAPPRVPRWESALSSLALRTPVRREIGRRHAAYLDDLTKRFRSGDLTEALHRAIPIGGLGSDALNLRLPGRRESLQVSRSARRARGSTPLGPTVDHHLRTLYAEAAEALERQGRVDEAVFVYADLLNRPSDAVAVLERAKRWFDAADLAEGRELEGERIVRLWFRAGERYRAVQAARRSGGFALAVERLGSEDPELARALRADWLAAELAAGNVLGAVAAAWPEPDLRPAVADAIDRSIDAGGDLAATLRAYRIAARPSAAFRDDTFAFLADSNPGATERRRLFAATLADVRIDDPVADREVTSATILAMVGDPRPASHAGRLVGAAVRKLEQRADRLLVVDLPSPLVEARSSAVSSGPVQRTLDPASGVPARDAALLPNGTVLVALGEHGAALLRDDGRIAARWDVPTDALVVADHGSRALLVRRGAGLVGERLDVHTLDLPDRRLRHWGVIEASEWTRSFDGGGWVVIDRRGLAILDTTAPHPVVTWRELEPEWIVLDLQRSPSGLGALVGIPDRFGAIGLQRWAWRLPRMHLAVKSAVDGSRPSARRILADGTMVEMVDDGSGPTLLGPGGFVRYGAEQVALACGARSTVVAVMGPGGDATVGRVDVWRNLSSPAASIVVGGVGHVSVRDDGGPVTVCDDRGRIVALSPDLDEVVFEGTVRTA